MLSKEEVEAGKQCLKDVIVNTYAEGKAIKLENLYKYIEHLEAKLKELGKGHITLMQSRKKWKNRYYKERAKGKEVIEDLKEVRHNLEKDGFVGYADEIEDIIQLAISQVTIK